MTKDPYRYFRIEARELLEGLGACVLELERAPSNREVVGRLLRLAHTLKGASRVVRLGAIAEEAHAIEDVLAPLRDAAGPVAQVELDRLLRLVDGIGARIGSLDPAVAPERAPAPAVQAPERAAETVRVEIDEVDRLLESVTEVTVLVGALGRQSARLDRALHLAAAIVDQLGPRRNTELGGRATRELEEASSLAEELRGSLEGIRREVADGLEEVGGELRQVRDGANRLRLLAASSVFPSLERAARDAAQSLGRRIAFGATGGEIRVDAHVLVALRDALIHVVRNAVAHGIESSPERLAVRKPADGSIALSVERRGHRIAFRCRDDGRGVDVEAVRRVAASRGLLPAGAPAPGAAEVLRLLLRGGLTTAASVTEVSGRGVGLDVVRETAARLRGEATLDSEPGVGTTVEICVPVSMSSLPALVVDAAGISASVPLDAVRQTLRLADSDIARSADADSIVFEGRVIPFVRLARALRRPATSGRRRPQWPAVIVQSGTALAAVGVDRLLGVANVVVRALPSQAAVDVVVAGAALDAEGHPQLVLDPEGLVAAARIGRGALPESDPAPRPAVLVIDDSLTTRMLEQSILESAGYEVELAISAEEALGKARGKRYGLFVVDVEMPGMDGFEFVTRTRADPILRDTPAILVTSRGSSEDRQRGREAGASGYIVKGEFDQGKLLQTIRDLIGAGR